MSYKICVIDNDDQSVLVDEEVNSYLLALSTNQGKTQSCVGSRGVDVVHLAVCISAVRDTCSYLLKDRPLLKVLVEHGDGLISELGDSAREVRDLVREETNARD